MHKNNNSHSSFASRLLANDRWSGEAVVFRVLAECGYGSYVAAKREPGHVAAGGFQQKKGEEARASVLWKGKG